MKEKNAWILLIVLRAVMCFSTGYVHPDEHFQSPEVTAASIFNITAEIPWEFSSNVSLRSPSIAMISTGIPFLIASKLIGHSPSPALLFIIPRISSFLFSFLNDLSVFMISKAFPLEVPLWPALISLSSSWPIFVFFVRPFSNSLEASLLAISISITIIHIPKSFVFSSILGFIVSLGIFTRPTFVLFAALPISICIIYTILFQQHQSRKSLPKSLVSPLVSFVTCLITTILIILYDTSFYSSQNYVISPLNFIKYNSNSSNLSQHGSHPRWLHSLINTPLLFLHLIPFALTNFFTLKRPFLICSGVIMSGISFLSTATHQEPRFLIPLLVPFVILASKPISILFSPKRKENFLILKTICLMFWFCFNLSLTLYFGVFHQGGIAQSLIYLGNQIQSSKQQQQQSVIVFFHTYMPPRYILSFPKEKQDQLSIIDLSGNDFKVLNQTLNELFDNKKNGSDYLKTIWTVIPSSMNEITNVLVNNFKMKLDTSFWPHLSNEDPPKTIKDLKLNLYIKKT